MCQGGADETPHGLRVYEGRWADGYIGRHPVRPGYAFVTWKGRHVAEPSELSADEAAGFWSDVARVAAAVDAEYGGNGVPHLHVHLVPRPQNDARAGGPLESEAFDVATTPAIPPAQLEAEAATLRARLQG
jgi:diadenosine tetraphosphate (Ap4A) HIT family hydrolase